MNTSFHSALGCLAFTILLMPHHVEAQALPCDRVSDAVRASVSRDPSKVLLIVEQSIRENDVCACEITKAAIVASKADSATIKQIVFTAAVTAPGMAASIGECALAVAPDASVVINQAIQEAVGKEVAVSGSPESMPSNSQGKGGKEVVVTSGKQTIDKNPPPPMLVEPPDAPWAPPVVQDVYLIQPVGGIFVPPCRTPVSPSTVKLCKNNQY